MGRFQEGVPCMQLSMVFPYRHKPAWPIRQIANESR